MTSTARTIAALALVATLVSSSRAASIEFDDTYGPTAVPFPSTALVTLPKFDPILGTLTKVTLTLEAETSAGTIAWDNEADVPSDVTLGIGAEVTATAPSALTVVAVPLQVGSSTVDADNDGAADFVGTDAFSVVGGTGSDSDSDMTTLAAALTFYTGPGSFDVDVGSVVSTFLSTTGGFGPIAPVPGVTEGVVTVLYEYDTIVPEPSTILLATIGGLGLLIIYGRRRRATSR